MAHDLQAQALGLGGLAVMLAGEGHQTLGQTDEAGGQRAVLEHLALLVGGRELFGIDPHALAHEERRVVHVLASLNLEALVQLTGHELQLGVEQVEEQVDVALGADGQTGQVDGRERQVAAAGRHLAIGVVHVAHDAGAAAHVGDLGFRRALVVLGVERGIQEGEVREQALGRAVHGQLEQVVVRILRIVVHAFLHAEDLHGEDGRLAGTQALFRGQQHVLDDHAALGRRVHAVVHRAERRLRAGAGMHGVQVVHQRLHGLEGLAVGVAGGVLLGVGHDAVGRGLIGASLNEGGHHGGAEISVHLQRGDAARLLLDASEGLLGKVAVVGDVGQQVDALGDVLLEQTAVGLAHTHSQAVVEVADGLAAVLVVLVRLDGNAGQGRVAGDVVGLAQHAVAGGEAALEELAQLDLAAGGGQGVEVHVVDVNIALAVGLGVARIDDAHLVELLGRFRAVLQHGAHGGVGVDVGVLALHVGIGGLGEGDVLQSLDEARVHVAHAAALGAVEDVGLGGLHEAGLDEGFLHEILHAFNRGRALDGAALKLLDDRRGDLLGGGAILHGRASLERLLHRVGDLLGVELRCTPVALDDGLDHNRCTSFRLSRFRAVPTTTCRSPAMFSPLPDFRNS